MPFKAKKITPINTSSLDALGKSVIDLSKYTEDEFAQVASSFQDTEPDVIWNGVPPKPRRGTTAYADGTHWNPGAGEGPYFYNGSVWTPEFTDPATLSTISGLQTSVTNLQANKFQSIKIQVFNTAGTFTYTPSVGMKYCIIECIGGGGAGGGVTGSGTTFILGGGGGGSGGYSRKIATAAAVGVSQTVTVGAAGASGGTGAGGAGGTTSVGSLCVATGGGGGAATVSGGGTSAGTGAGIGSAVGDFTLPGRNGHAGNYINGSVSAVAYGGHGGDSFYGAGAITTVAGGSAANGAAGTAGGGGAGAATNVASSGSGGAGGPGLVIITEFCNA